MSFPLSPSDPVGKREPSRGPGHEERERPYWLAWARIKGIGPHRLKRLAEFFGSLKQAWQADALDLQQVEGIGPTLAQAIVSARPGLDPEEILEQTQKPGIPFLTPADPGYPPLLWELPDPPPLLYVLGECPDWQQPAIAVVGTRAPTSYGRLWTQKVSAALAEAGCVVVSGLATGIDGIAHQACLEAGGKTVAVVGTGVDQVYPAHHRSLYRRILEQGAVLSEYPPGTPPAKEHFPQRNRIIAGLCRATLVMEAPERSGALITAHLANHYGREVYALPGNIDTAAARGCLQLIRNGAGHDGAFPRADAGHFDGKRLRPLAGSTGAGSQAAVAPAPPLPGRGHGRLPRQHPCEQPAPRGSHVSCSHRRSWAGIQPQRARW